MLYERTASKASAQAGKGLTNERHICESLKVCEPFSRQVTVSSPHHGLKLLPSYIHRTNVVICDPDPTTASG
jgi:hypothetical protein